MGTVTSLADVDGIVTIDETGVITAACVAVTRGDPPPLAEPRTPRSNKNACKLFGYRSADELLGRDVKKVPRTPPQALSRVE